MLRLEKSDFTISPGQSLVLYDGKPGWSAEEKAKLMKSNRLVYFIGRRKE